MKQAQIRTGKRVRKEYPFFPPTPRRAEVLISKSALDPFDCLIRVKSRPLFRLNPGLAVVQRDGLSPLDDAKEIANHIKETKKNLLIIGHLPHLGKLASLLIAGRESVPIVSFQQGGVVCLEKAAEGLWSVVWMLVPEIL
ncbi:MAG: hypothetical protein V1758_07990 [Pseudomonadota bacterium]